MMTSSLIRFSLFVSVLVILSFGCSNKSQKERNNNIGLPAKEVAETYHIEFMAYNHSLDANKTPGHMFVEYWRNQNGNYLSEGRYGFGPDEGYTRDHFVNGIPWKGKFGEEDPGNPDNSFMKEVSRSNWNAAMQIKENWRNTSREYIGGKRDCITFGLQVAAAAGLVAERTIFPIQNVDLLRDNNQ